MKNKPSLNARVAPPIRWRVLFWLQLVTWALLAATLAGRLGNFFFLFELFSHFAVQCTILAAILLIFWLYTGPRLLAGASFMSLVANGVLVMPWLFAPKPPVSGPRDLRLLHANVLYTGTNYNDITQLVQTQSPDIFVLQEMTPESIRGVSPLKKTFPYQYHIWSKGPCSILVGSRTPIRVDSAMAMPQRVIGLKTTVRGREVALFTAHPQIPLLPSMFADRNQQLGFVRTKARQQQIPTVIVGDFNISVFSPVYHRLFEQSGLAACRWGFGLQPTWPRYIPLLFIPIDHAFVNSGFRTVNFQTLKQASSDHKAVVVDLAFTGSGSASQP